MERLEEVTVERTIEQEQFFCDDCGCEVSSPRDGTAYVGLNMDRVGSRYTVEWDEKLHLCSECRRDVFGVKNRDYDDGIISKIMFWK